ncbi:glycoside hydrolase family 3 N-terminal domain-containing protein [Segetibacter sp. 3557_3]|uniref:glycoside hydrolase family 3 N-terminal domain-containing protein n=1 Tax=Segetibacter sp. 3557_3 TaxID=2547429 RepID=UPI001A9E75A3|nr:glycoside hydrolase family 3 N-terminal domain-containing protein [Segetibacter sp. 3557_3]
MKKTGVLVLLLSLFTTGLIAQPADAVANRWVDSVFSGLSKEEKIAQLMIIRAHSNLGKKHVEEVSALIQKYNVGGLCFFQGGPVRQATLTNYYQDIAKTPLMISIDGEWGLGMRLDSVINFPRQLMIGAVLDAALVYQFGRAVGEQCKRLGIHVNFAPDVDVNNNPNNPVINDRSFGEDKYKVALYGIEYMRGMQDVGVMACAKHFPGHGDVDVDSHFDLPVINKSRAQLDSLELYPFREIFKAGVGSVMIAHLYIPAIDNIENQATSLSYKNVTGLLREELGYKGLTFTDALEMQGVTKFYPSGEASVQSLIAGNDMLCLPGDVPASIEKIVTAIKQGRLKQDDIDNRVKKVLLAKYTLGLSRLTPVDTANITSALNEQTNKINRLLAANALTLLQHRDEALVPLDHKKRIAYIGIGLDKPNAFAKRLQADHKADVYLFNYKRDLGTVPMLTEVMKDKYDAVVIGMHAYSRRPAANFALSYSALNFINRLQDEVPSVTLAFGNPYAIKNISNAPNLVACYEDDEITQNAAADLLEGKIVAKGKLPVTVSPKLPFGSGIRINEYLPEVVPDSVGFNPDALKAIDSLALDAVKQRATPGCVVLVARKGKVGFYKAYGHTNYDSTEVLNRETIFDLASVTKTSATTVSVMKLYEEGKLDLKKTLGDYLPWVKGSNKEGITIENLLLHQAGLVAYIPFYRSTFDAESRYYPGIYSTTPNEAFPTRVAENLYLNRAYEDTLLQRILRSPLGPANQYVYSDNDFIFLGKVVEAVSGQKLEEYVRQTFYLPLNMTTTGFRPLDHFAKDEIAPTELDKEFRKQQLRGDVHDQGAAMFGGVAGHAGLFSNAYDLVQLYQLLLNGGELNGVRLLKKETIDYFTAYHSPISRRGLGFDKPEKDNATRKDPYPTRSASPATFGHTGYTGIGVWVDPAADLIYIFLSNRVAPNGDMNRLIKMNVRSNIHEAIYKAIKPTQESTAAN